MVTTAHPFLSRDEPVAPNVGSERALHRGRRIGGLAPLLRRAPRLLQRPRGARGRLSGLEVCGPPSLLREEPRLFLDGRLALALAARAVLALARPRPRARGRARVLLLLRGAHRADLAQAARERERAEARERRAALEERVHERGVLRGVVVEDGVERLKGEEDEARVALVREEDRRGRDAREELHELRRRRGPQVRDPRRRVRERDDERGVERAERARRGRRQCVDRLRARVRTRCAITDARRPTVTIKSAVVPRTFHFAGSWTLTGSESCSPNPGSAESVWIMYVSARESP